MSLGERPMPTRAHVLLTKNASFRPPIWEQCCASHCFGIWQVRPPNDPHPHGRRRWVWHCPSPASALENDLVAGEQEFVEHGQHDGKEMAEKQWSAHTHSANL